MDKELKAKKMISFEISDELREALRQQAFAEKMSISKLIRKILTEHVNTNIDKNK